MQLIVIRHARPVRIESDEGVADPPLAEIGHAQAEAVAEHLARLDIDHVVSSPLRRARQTAEPLARRVGLAVVEHDFLAEFDAGASSYIPTEEAKAEGGELWETLRTDPFSLYDGDAGEWMDNVQRGFEHLVAAHAGDTVAVFCHGMVTSALLHRWLGTDEVLALRPEYASVTWIEASARHDSYSVRTVNETQHLGDLRLEAV